MSSTFDVEPFLSQEQQCVGVGVDMALAIDKAEIFCWERGEFFSFLLPCWREAFFISFFSNTVSANVVMLRIVAKGLQFTRGIDFWNLNCVIST